MDPTKHRKEHKGANLFKNTRILTTTNHKGPQRTQESKFINTRISTREHKGPRRKGSMFPLLCLKAHYNYN